MGRPETVIDPTEGPVQQFSMELRELRRKAGSPTYREMSKRVHYSVAALSEAARGTRRPTLEITRAFVEACAGDVPHWEERWRKLNAELGIDEEAGEAGEVREGAVRAVRSRVPLSAPSQAVPNQGVPKRGVPKRQVPKQGVPRQAVPGRAQGTRLPAWREVRTRAGGGPAVRYAATAACAAAFVAGVVMGGRNAARR